MEASSHRRFKFGIGVALLIIAFGACSTSGDRTSRTGFWVSHIKGQARRCSDSGANWQALRPGDRLRVGDSVQTPADPGYYADIVASGLVTVRIERSSFVTLSGLGSGDGGSATVTLTLRTGTISIRAESAATALVATTNGVIRISNALAHVYGCGDVDALTGSAYVFETKNTSPIEVPQGNRYDAATARVYVSGDFH